MNFKSLVNASKFFIKKNSPVILLTTGIIASGASVVTACIATSKLQKNNPIKDANIKLDAINTKVETKEITTDQAKKERFGVFTKTGWKLIKLYSAPVALFGLSTACLIGGNKIMSSRNAALSAGISALQSSYCAYRQKVAEKLGKSDEEQIYKESIENPNKKYISNGITKNVSRDYDFFFDPACSQWEPDGRLNLNYLNTLENFFNRQLDLNGYVTMYDILFGSKGFRLNPGMFTDEVISSSRFFGWLRDNNTPDRDSFISFGIYDKSGDNSVGAINMQRYGEKNFFVRFNSPYYIYDKIPKIMKEKYS